MDIYIFSQTLFFLSVSFFVIVTGAFFVLFLYKLVAIMKHLENIAENIDDTASDLGERFANILDKLESLPILSYFFKRKPKRKKKQ